LKERTGFGPWTLVAIVGWVAGMIAALVVVWRLWAGWYRM
jgi:hypothetical protein